ncbi:MAG: (Fe-S)-binding protein [Acidimicrobiales bacterium]
MRIALFVTCMNNAIYPRTGRAVVTVLERLGHEVVFPEPQTCCGQMHLNAGYRREGLALAASVLSSFASADAIVVPSGSCTVTMRDLWADVATDEGDHDLAARARDFAPRVHEFTELLVDVLGVEDVGARFAHRVAYHPTCHSLRAQRVGDRPLRLLRAVEGIELVELERPDSCCGFGGLFSVKNPDTSAAMGVDKVADVASSGAQYLCATDNSCLTHIGAIAAHDETPPPFQTIHLAEILASGGTSR